ncbi:MULTISPECIES: hypothetical protein [unclassified Saccharothrix]|uniref:hypothetical protein n=1 Tax=unclassified Saccharothrix TaxID=2593673 RepID=UPI00307D8933
MAARGEAQADVEVSTLVVPAWRLRWRAPELALVLGERAVALASARRDEVDRLRAESLVVFASNRVGRGVKVADRALDALKAAEAESEHETAWRLRVELADIARAVGAPLTGFAAVRPVLEAEGVPDALRASALVQASECLVSVGRGSALTQALEEADQLYTSDPVLDHDTALLLRGTLRASAAGQHRRWGDLDAAIAAAREGIELLDQLTAPESDSGQVRGGLIVELVCALMDADKHAEASETGTPFLEQPVRAPSATAAGWLRLALASRVHLPAGRVDQSRDLLREAADSAERHQLDTLLAESLLALAHVHEVSGDLTEALANLRSAHAAERRRARSVYAVRARLAAEFSGVHRQPSGLHDQLAALLREGTPLRGQPEAGLTPEAKQQLRQWRPVQVHRTEGLRVKRARRAAEDMTVEGISAARAHAADRWRLVQPFGAPAAPQTPDSESPESQPSAAHPPAAHPSAAQSPEPQPRGGRRRAPEPAPSPTPPDVSTPETTQGRPRPRGGTYLEQAFAHHERPTPPLFPPLPPALQPHPPAAPAHPAASPHPTPAQPPAPQPPASQPTAPQPQAAQAPAPQTAAPHPPQASTPTEATPQFPAPEPPPAVAPPFPGTSFPATPFASTPITSASFTEADPLFPPSPAQPLSTPPAPQAEAPLVPQVEIPQVDVPPTLQAPAVQQPPATPHTPATPQAPPAAPTPSAAPPVSLTPPTPLTSAQHMSPVSQPAQPTPPAALPMSPALAPPMSPTPPMSPVQSVSSAPSEPVMPSALSTPSVPGMSSVPVTPSMSSGADVVSGAQVSQSGEEQAGAGAARAEAGAGDGAGAAAGSADAGAGSGERTVSAAGLIAAAGAVRSGRRRAAREAAEGEGQGEQQAVVPQGSDGGSVLETLKAAGLLDSQRAGGRRRAPEAEESAGPSENDDVQWRVEAPKRLREGSGGDVDMFDSPAMVKPSERDEDLPPLGLGAAFIKGPVIPTARVPESLPEPTHLPEPPQFPEPTHLPESARLPESAQFPEPTQLSVPPQFPEPTQLSVPPQFPEPTHSPEPTQSTEPSQFPELPQLPELPGSGAPSGFLGFGDVERDDPAPVTPPPVPPPVPQTAPETVPVVESSQAVEPVSVEAPAVEVGGESVGSETIGSETVVSETIGSDVIGSGVDAGEEPVGEPFVRTVVVGGRTVDLTDGSPSATRASRRPKSDLSLAELLAEALVAYEAGRREDEAAQTQQRQEGQGYRQEYLGTYAVEADSAESTVPITPVGTPVAAPAANPVSTSVTTSVGTSVGTSGGASAVPPASDAETTTPIERVVLEPRWTLPES